MRRVGLMLFCLSLVPLVAWAQVDIPTLETELTTDPNGYGYQALIDTQDYGGLADMVNVVRDTITVDRVLVTASDLIQAVVPSEYSALAAVARDYWADLIVLATTGAFPVDDANIRNAIAEIWGPGTTTRSNLVALQTRDGSRAEQLFGVNVTVTISQVREALLE